MCVRVRAYTAAACHRLKPIGMDHDQLFVPALHQPTIIRIPRTFSRCSAQPHGFKDATKDDVPRTVSIQSAQD